MIKKHNRNATKNTELEMQHVIRLIAGIPDMEPPESLVDSVMSNLKPKQLPWWKKFWYRFYTPICITPVKMAPVGILFFLFLTSSFYLGLSSGTRRLTPITASNNQKADNTETIVFLLKNKHASRVSVIGSFNHWSPKGYQMRYDEKHGIWALPVRLPKGRYEYSFLLNGKIIIPDPRALIQKDDGFGNKNSLLIVERGNENKTHT